MPLQFRRLMNQLDPFEEGEDSDVETRGHSTTPAPPPPSSSSHQPPTTKVPTPVYNNVIVVDVILACESESRPWYTLIGCGVVSVNDIKLKGGPHTSYK